MRKIVYAFIFALGIGFAGISAASAAPVQPNTGATAAVAESGVRRVNYWRHCERLRRACIYKEERGESGEGNCRRYREECGERSYSYCERLRDACRYKEELGESGEGNCRRYRDECSSQ